MAKSKAWRAQRQQARTKRHEAKRRDVRNAYRPQTVPKSERVQRVISRQPQPGMPRLVKQALDRMEARFKLLTMSRVADAPDELAA